MLSNAGVLGREAERHRLIAAIEDPAVRLVVIRGEAGAGKTALAREALAAVPPPVLCAVGKHAEGSAGASTRAAGQALAGLLDQALDQLHDPEAGLASLRTAMGPSAAILAALDPVFGALEDPALAAPVTSEAAAERLAQAAVGFLRWVSGLGLPMLLLLDDWGRARGQAERLYERLAREPDLAGLTLIATERTAEPSPIAADLLIDLAPLSREALHAIAAERLAGDTLAASSVLGLLPAGPITPLALIQTLQGLADAGALTRRATGWSLDRTAAAATLGQDVAQTLLRRILAAAPDQRRLLEAAAVFGDAADRAHLEPVADLAAAFDPALAALAAESLLETDGPQVRFRHDTIRAAALAGLDPTARARLAGLWSEQLRRHAAPRGADLEAMLRLRLEAGLTAADPAGWAPLFVAGAAAARAAGAPGQARAFAEAALGLEDRARAASYAAAREASLAAVQDGDLAAGQELARLMEARATGEAQHLEAAETAVFAARLSGDPARAFAVGRAAVARFGLYAPERAALPAMLAALVALRLTPDTPVRGAAAHSPAAHRLLNTLGAIAFERDPGVAVVMAARSAIHPALRGGAFAASLRTMLSCLTGDWKSASRWGQTVFDRLDRDQPLRAAAMQLALQFGLGLTIDAARQFAEAERLQALALSEGDLGVAAYANRDRALASMRMAHPLARHRQVLADCKANAARFRDQATEPLIDALTQLAINLAEGGPEPWRLAGEVFDSPRFERDCGPQLENVAMAAMTFEALLANGFGAWETTLSVWRRMGPRFDALRHHPVTAIWAFHTALARARLGMPLRRWEIAVVDRSARFNPASYDHRRLALRAETLLASGRVAPAMQAYEAALVAGARSGFQMEQAVVAVAAQAAARQAARPDLAARFAAAEQTAWRALGATAMLKDTDPADPAEAPTGEGAPSEALAKAGADRASRAKTRLLAGAAHELRTPMQGIQGLLDLAADDPAALDVARLREAFGSLSAVVDDLTELGAVEAERLAIVDAPFSPLRLAETELGLALRSFSEAGRDIALETNGDIPAEALGDAGRIAQIVRNLLTNALRYGEGQTTLRLAADDDTLAFEVLDHGPGLTAADQVRLFQPFVRGDAADRAEGSGLGLALSRRLARRMAGDLTGENRPEGQGAIFRLTLPLRRPDPRLSLRSLGEGGGEAGRPLRILLAEDTDLSRETLARLLTRQGHAVTAVPDGPAALAAARSQPFDLLILDVRMPGLDGPSALAQLRAEGLTTPALVLTASVDEPLSRRLAGLEPVRLARKPLTAAQLSHLAADFAASDGIDAVLGEDAEDIRAQVTETLRQRAAEVLAWRETGFAAAREAAHAAAGLAAQFGLADAEAAFAAAERAAGEGDEAGMMGSCEGLTSFDSPIQADGSKRS